MLVYYIGTVAVSNVLHECICVFHTFIQCGPSITVLSDITHHVHLFRIPMRHAEGNF